MLEVGSGMGFRVGLGLELGLRVGKEVSRWGAVVRSSMLRLVLIKVIHAGSC